MLWGSVGAYHKVNPKAETRGQKLFLIDRPNIEQ